jgi:hypothetical protein
MKDYAYSDVSKFPIIVVKFSGVEATDENFKVYLEHLNNLYDNYGPKQKFTLIFDATTAAKPNLKYQKMQAEWIKDKEAIIKKYCYGIGYIMPNALYRIALMVVFSIENSPVPFKVFGNMEDATSWAKELNA